MIKQPLKEMEWRDAIRDPVIWGMWKQGRSFAEVGRLCGLSRDGVRKICDKKDLREKVKVK